MPFWFTLLLFAASTILGQLFRPKSNAPKPATLAELDFPTAEETRSIPKGYGTFLMKAPNVVSVTDFSSEVIKSKVDIASLILSFGLAKKQTIGYKYFCGMEMALAYRIDALTQIIIGDKVAWSGEVTTDSEIYINKPSLFGGNDSASGGNGGVVGYLGVHVGLPNAAKDDYLVSEYGNYSAHRGVSYVVFKGQHRAKGSGYLGNSDRIEAWQFVARFIPNNLPYATYGYSNRSNINNGDANPAEVLYDIFRSAEYAIGMPQQYVDLASFTYAAKMYHDDSLGFSALWDTSKPCRDIINQILQLTDSVIYSDLATGKLVVKAARADYVLADIPSYTDKEILSISSYTRGAWAETTNAIAIPFVDRLDNFASKSAPAFNVANQRIQGATISSNVNHIGISNPQTAANIAQRDLKAMSTPLAKVTFQISLKGYRTTIGSTFKFSTKRIKDHNGNAITNMVMRCTGVKIGTPTNPVIEIEAIEDIFNSVTALIAAPPVSSGVSTSVAPVATATYVIDEVPYMLAGSDSYSSIWSMAKAPNTGSYSYDLFTSLDNVTYEPDDSNNDYTPTGLLNAAYASNTSAVDNSHIFVVTGASGSNLDKLAAATATEISNGKNLMLVVEGAKAEIMAFESFTMAGSDYVFNNVWRGLLDTVPQDFTAAARVWFFSSGDGRSNGFAPGATVYSKILTRTLQGVLDETAATAVSRVVSVRSLRPYAPGNVRVNGVYNGAIPVSGDITLAWYHRDRTRQGTVITQTAASVGLEGGTVYTLKIYNQAGTLLRTVSNLITESYIYTNTQEMADNGGVLAGALTFQLYSTRDGITSLQAQQRGSTRGASVPYVPVFVPSGNYTAPAAGSATSISGIPITGTPTNTNTTPVYDPTTGTITWQPGGAGITIREIDGTPSGVATILEIPNGQLTDMGSGVFRITPLQGATGSTGAAGSKWYVGSGVPANSLGVDGDYYLRSSTGDVYQKSISVYSIVANIKGAAGAFIDSSIAIATNPAGTFTQGTITTAGSRGKFIKITFDAAARFRAYSSAANRTADFYRPATQLATSDDNVLYEVVSYAGHLIFEHRAQYANNDVPVSNNLYWTVEGAVAVNITLVIQIEQIA